MLRGTQHGNGGTGLGQAVGIGEIRLRKQRHGLFDHGKRHLAAAVGERLEVRHPGGRFAFQRRDDAGKHGRHHEGRGDAFGAGGLDPCIGAEVRQLHDAPTGVYRAQRRRDAGDVVRRHANQRRIVFVRRHELDRTDDVRNQVLMAQHRGFGNAGGAAGEEQNADIFRVHRALFVWVAAGAGDSQKVAARTRIDAVAVLKVRQTVVARHQIGRRNPCQQGVDLFGGEAVVDRYVRYARPTAGEQRDRHREIAHVQHGDAAGARFADVVSGRTAAS